MAAHGLFLAQRLVAEKSPQLVFVKIRQIAVNVALAGAFFAPVAGDVPLAVGKSGDRQHAAVLTAAASGIGRAGAEIVERIRPRHG